MPKKEPIEESVFEEDSETQKSTLIPRAVSIPDMFNFISDKLDLIIQGQEEIKTLAKD